MNKAYIYSTFLFFLLIHNNNHSLFAQSFGSMNDERDGKIYKTITIGNQTWMAQNLAYSSGSIKCFAYNNDPTLIQKYGGLYNWENANNSCPNGWKLPSNEDWLNLSNYLGNEFKPKLMKTGAWRSDELTSNSSGFSAIPAGMVDNTGTFRNLGLGAYFWSSTFSHQSFAFARELGQNAGNYASHAFGSNVNFGMSVRCLKIDKGQSDDNDELDDEHKEEAYQEPEKQTYPSSGYGPNITYNGNTYKTVYIGTQQWMAENLKTAKYNDGTSILNVKDNTQWSRLEKGAWSYYNNDETKNVKYGKLYNWYAVSPTTNGNKNVCPTGWHVPTDDEWSVLIDYLGGESVAGGKMKEVGTKNWDATYTDATNTSLFTGLPGGNRDYDGIYYAIGNGGYWWSSTESEYGTDHAWARRLNHGDGYAESNYYVKKDGFSVRCLKD
jgi:uncharacterized protein (TIGR02145 family)